MPRTSKSPVPSAPALIGPAAKPRLLMAAEDALRVVREIAMRDMNHEDPARARVGDAMVAVLDHVSNLEMTIEKYRIGLNQAQMAERDCPEFALVGTAKRG